MQRQTAVYWPLEVSGDDFDDYGQPVVVAAEPVEISCRWEDVSEEFIDKNGTRQISHSKVYTDQDVDVGGILMLGTKDDITDSTNIKENENAWEIRRFDKLPNLKNTEFLRTVFL